MKRLWDLDDIQSGITDFDVTTVTKRSCGLQYDVCGNPQGLSNNHCFPRKITRYTTIHALREGIKGHRASYDEIVDKILQGELYSPNEDPSLYKMDTYNEENNFAVIMRNGRNTNWYSQDCCALISHIEKEKKEAEISNNPLGDLSDDGVHNEYYLKIKFYYIDNNIETNSGTNYLYNGEIYNPNKEHLFSSTNFYRISPCGKIYSDVIF